MIDSYGLDPRSLFESEGVTITLPVDSEDRIPYEKIDRVRARAAELSGDEAFGIRFGDYMHPSYMGALGFAWLASRTLRIALNRWRQYIRILNSHARLEILENAELIELNLCVDLPSKNLPVRDDAAMAVLTEMMRYNYGPGLPLASVSLHRPRPRNDGNWQRFFGCEVEFDAPHNAVRLPSDMADTILPSANPRLAQLNEDLAVQYLERLDREDFTGCVRAEIVRQLACSQFNQNQVAEALHITPRTMRRRLQAEETTFKELVTTIRRHLANEYVQGSEMTLTEISFNLGFAELSSFTRAYRNWHGHSPTHARSNPGATA
ncbi:MAG: AraC family transcriptional regulator [Gammaproteobacteria bacterium]|nr:AraC family transcriptional regulator [Gammaproteobacteria bacterium]